MYIQIWVCSRVRRVENAPRPWVHLHARRVRGCRTKVRTHYGCVLMLGVCERPWNTKTPNSGRQTQKDTPSGWFVLGIYDFLYSNS